MSGLVGPFVGQFEEAVAKYISSKHAVAVSSATAGFELVLRTLKIGAGHEVIIPEFGWTSLGAVAAAVGASVRVAPVDESLSAPWEAIEPLLRPQTRAVILVHMRGHPAKDVALIAQQLRARHVWLIEDCAQAWGTKAAGRHVGSFGDFGVFSTQH